MLDGVDRINRGTPAAAGYHQYGNSGLFCPPQIQMGVIERFHECSFLPYMSCTKFKLAYDKCMVFDKLPEIKVKPLQKNQVYKPDVWKPLEVKVRVGEANYFDYKIDRRDYEKMCNQSLYQQSIIQGASQSLHNKIACDMLAHIVANVACENQGQYAGKLGRVPINTGYPGNPIPIYPENIDDLYVDAKSILRQQDIYVSDRDCTNENLCAGWLMFMPSEMERIMMKSDVMKDLLYSNCEGACENLIDGLLPKKLLGFQTIITNCLPVGYNQSGEFEGFYVIAMSVGAIAFGGVKEEIWIGDGRPRDNGLYLIGEYEHGFHLFYPEAVVVFYVQPLAGPPV